MKKIDKFCLSKSVTILDREEMKKIKGKGYKCTRASRPGEKYETYHMSDVSFEFGYLYCDIWTDLGWYCTCESN